MIAVAGQDGVGEPAIHTIDRVEARIVARDWPFARERAAEIAAHWRSLRSAKPHLYDGRVLLQWQWQIEAGAFRASYLETRYSAFIAWRDFGCPDRSVRNGFAMAALRARDGAFLLGEMGPHTANAGKVYFAAGTPDLNDVTPTGEVDLLASIRRELEEETGLGPAEVRLGEGWTLVMDGGRNAFLRPALIDMPAEAARALILSRLAHQARPELADIRIVRSRADIDRHAMPPFACAFLARALAAN